MERTNCSSGGPTLAVKSGRSGHPGDGDESITHLSQHQKRKLRVSAQGKETSRQKRTRATRRFNARERRRALIEDGVALDMLESGARDESRDQVELINAAMVDDLASDCDLEPNDGEPRVEARFSNTIILGVGSNTSALEDARLLAKQQEQHKLHTQIVANMPSVVANARLWLEKFKRKKAEEEEQDAVARVQHLARVGVIHDRASHLLTHLACPVTPLEKDEIATWFNNPANQAVAYHVSDGQTSFIHRQFLENLRGASKFLSGNIYEYIISKLGSPHPVGIPTHVANAVAFHAYLYTLAKDEPVALRSSWACLYKRIVPILAKVDGAESAAGHNGICIPVHTGDHWVLIVLHLQRPSFTVYNSINSHGVAEVKKAIDTIQHQLKLMARQQNQDIHWYETKWVSETVLAQQYDMRNHSRPGGDCLLFVACWALCIMGGDTPDLTTIQQQHMRNLRDQLLLMAIRGDVNASQPDPSTAEPKASEDEDEDEDEQVDGLEQVARHQAACIVAHTRGSEDEAVSGGMPPRDVTECLEADLVTWGMNMVVDEADPCIRLGQRVQRRWLEAFDALSTCSAQGAVLWARRDLCCDHELFQESSGGFILLDEVDGTVYSWLGLAEIKSFVTGKLRWFKDNLNAVIAVCMALQGELCNSLELLRGVLVCVDFTILDEAIDRVLIPHGWVWTMTQTLCPDEECMKARIGEASDSMDAWLGGFTHTDLRLLWAMMLKQQETNTSPCPTLEVFVTILFTLREQDFLSLGKAQSAILLLRAGDGLVSNIANCVRHCAYDSKTSQGSCRDECVLRQAFATGVQRNTNLHVKAMRQVVKLVPGLLSPKQAMLFPGGYLGVHESTRLESLIVHRSHALNPSGQCLHPNCLLYEEWVQVPGVAEVVFGKLLSLHRVGDWSICESPVVIAVDTKITGLLLRMPPGSTAEDWGDEVFGCTRALPFKALASKAKAHGFDHLGTIIHTMARGDHERRVYRTNAWRSKISTQIQNDHVQAATERMCTDFGYNVMNARHVDSLRESLRFMFDLSGLQVSGASNGPSHHSNVDICQVAFNGIHEEYYVPTHGLGPAYVTMDAMLQPQDVAYWWQHPGQLVRVEDYDMDTLTLHNSICRVFTGITRGKAIEAAMHSCESKSDLIVGLSDKTIGVCYWGMRPTNNTTNNATSSWGFEMSPVLNDTANIGTSSLSNMLSGFYMVCGSGTVEKRSIEKRVKEIMADHDGELVVLMETLTSTFSMEPLASMLQTQMAEVHDRVTQEHGSLTDHVELRLHMSEKLLTMYEVTDPRLIFMVSDHLALGDTQRVQDCEALQTSLTQYSLEQPWKVMRGVPQCWQYVARRHWIKLSLGGPPRHQKEVTCDLGVHFQTLTSYAIKNTPISQSQLFASQRQHQTLHCDLPYPGVVTNSKTSVSVAQRVHVLLAPLGDVAIALQVWDHIAGIERTIWIHKGEYIVFPAASCWHAGYGGQQGDRLYVTFVLGKLSTDDLLSVIHDQDHVLKWTDMKGTPVANPQEWQLNSVMSYPKHK